MRKFALGRAPSLRASHVRKYEEPCRKERSLQELFAVSKATSSAASSRTSRFGMLAYSGVGPALEPALCLTSRSSTFRPFGPPPDAAKAAPLSSDVMQKIGFLTFGVFVISFIASCSMMGARPPEPLPGRHAYSIRTIQGNSWIEFSCELAWDDLAWALRGGPRIRQFYSSQRTFKLRFKRKNGSYQTISLPTCEQVNHDGRFPANAFRGRNSTIASECVSSDGRQFMEGEPQNYRCWGNLDDLGYVVEYFYLSDQ